MQTTFSSYNYAYSIDRINEILNSSDYNYQEKHSIPLREELTFTNGFYVDCSTMFVDMRGSQELSNKYKRPTLVRIYRSYISELIAVMRSHPKVCELNIQGDCVWGIYDTQYKADIDPLFAPFH